MAKEWFYGAVPVVVVFLFVLGVNIAPLLLIAGIAVLLYFIIQRQGGLGKKKKNTFQTLETTNVSFDHIGGLKRPKQELREAIDFLKEDEKAERYGIRPLKGILLTGPPGTGKTLMAKAAAQYANAAFVAASGSEFVEMYVGVGASRIRDMFKEVKRIADEKGLKRAIIFIDEIDAIGGKREGQQQKEYDQTLNQLLTEMDGMTTLEKPRILIMAATNRKDMLDEALLRPGRFDRHIQVDKPDKSARLHILSIHFKQKPIADDVCLEDVAADTYGFSGAQLESVANEAAIYAFREQSSIISPSHISQAIDKVMMGEQTDRESTSEEKKRVAYHELGHAIVSEVLRPHSVSQVVLAPRGGALGYVRQAPAQEQYLYTKSYIEQQIMVCLAGAVTEEIYFGERSTGSKNDFDQAMQAAYQLIDAGLSSLGIVNIEHIDKTILHNETSRILDELLVQTKQLIQAFDSVFHDAYRHLENEERISGDEFRALLRNCQDQKEIS